MSRAPSTTCSDAILVEAMHDDRLGPRERAAIERHLQACVHCTAHLAFLRGLSGAMREELEPPMPLAVQRARRELLRSAAEPVRAAGPRRAIRMGGIAFAALLVAGGAWAAFGSSEKVEPNAIESAVPAPRGAAALGASPSSSSPSPSVGPDASASSAEVVKSPPPSAAPSPSSVARATPPPTPFAGPQRTGSARASHDAAPAEAPPADTASREFADAVDAVGRGDYGAGAERLRQFSSAHPDDARADDADYLLAVSLQRAHRVDDAAAAAQRYLDTHPRGAHRPEAEALIRKAAARP